MKRVLQVGRDVKAKKAKARRERVKELMGVDLGETAMGLKLQLIQELIPLALIHVGEVLKEEVSVMLQVQSKQSHDLRVTPSAVDFGLKDCSSNCQMFSFCSRVK